MAEFIRRDAPLTEPIRVVVVAAHPDDIEFGPAGSVARWISEGADVTYVIVTDAGSGSNDPDVNRDDLVKLRQEEQMAAAAIVGVEDVRFLNYPDGTLTPTLELRRDITRIIREIKPQRVVISDPTTIFVESFYINHPDHRAAAEAALYAVFPSAETRPIFPELLDEGLEPHKVNELYMNFSEKPDVYVDTTDFIERKIESLRCHVSQLGEGEAFDNGVKKMVEAWSKESGAKVGTGAAEFFRVMVLNRPDNNNNNGDGSGTESRDGNA